MWCYFLILLLHIVVFLILLGKQIIP